MKAKAVGICPISGWNVEYENKDGPNWVFPVAALVLFENGVVRPVSFAADEGPVINECGQDPSDPNVQAGELEGSNFVQYVPDDGWPED